MKIYRLTLSISLLVLGVTGCAGVTPKENFVNHRNCDIGTHVSQLSPGDSLGSLTRKLDNGNTEYTRVYLHPLGRCEFVREVDAKTERIVAWRILGDDSGCLINP